MTCGVYMLVNSVTGMKYIGQSFDIEKRSKEHFQNGVLTKANGPLYDAIREHGKHCWEIFVLWELKNPDTENARDILHQKEQEFIAAYETTTVEKGYNLSTGGFPASGIKMSEETRQKMSESHLGEKHHLFGKHLSEETRKKIGEKHKGKQITEEHRKKISEKVSGEKHPLFGKKHSEESKQKMSEAQAGEKSHMWGKTVSEETKRKMAEARRKYWENKRSNGHNLH